MTTPTLVPTKYTGDTKPWLRAKVEKDGAARLVQDKVLIPSGTAANAIAGLVPFQKGARVSINSQSIYAENFGAGTTTLNVGYCYDDSTNNTDSLAAWASASTAPQSGGFVSVTIETGLSFIATGNGWIMAQLLTAAADADASIAFNILVSYDS